ncbi:small basic family protein [bacterium]|nr:small basic family protein [bacterium]
MIGALVTLGGLIVGILLGAIAPLSIPQVYSKYFAVAILAALDTGFGGVRSGLEGRFGLAAFISGFTANTLFAAGLTYLGDQLGIDLYLAAIVVFGVRIFENLAMIRRLILGRFWTF